MSDTHKTTNEMRYKTAKERIEAFRAWRKEKCGDLAKGCKGCGIRSVCDGNDVKLAHWLALEAEEEKPEYCPFCGSMVESRWHSEQTCLVCKNGHCGYVSGKKLTEAEAIAAHNRVARAVRAAKEGEAK